MIRLFQMKKLSTTKFYNFFSRFTTFVLVVFSYKVIWKTQKINFKLFLQAVSTARNKQTKKNKSQENRALLLSSFR